MKALKVILALLVVSVMLLSACAPAAPAEPETIVVTQEVEVEKEVIVTQIVEVEKDPNAPVYGGTLVVPRREFPPLMSTVSTKSV